MEQSREYRRLNQCITHRALGMDMRRHNGTFGADPRIMCLTRVLAQRFPKGGEIMPLFQGRTLMTERGWRIACKRLCQSVNGMKIFFFSNESSNDKSTPKSDLLTRYIVFVQSVQNIVNNKGGKD